MTKNKLMKKMSTPEQVREFMRTKAQQNNCYCSWIDYDKEPIIRTWGFRRTKKHGFEYTEVLRESLAWIITKSMYCNYICGYSVVYQYEDTWNDIEKSPGIYSIYLNLEAIYQKDFKYCGYQPRCGDLIKYLRLYAQYPEVEYLGKLGIRPNETLIRKCKDKQFCKFLISQKKQLDISIWNTRELTFAFKNKLGLYQARQQLNDINWANKSTQRWTNIKTKGLNRVKIAKFAFKNGFSSYRDYWEAINYLGYDILDTKNTYPRDFQRMHDLRIAEYESQKAKEDKNKSRLLSKQIKKVAEKYKSALIENRSLCVIFPEKITDFKNEGKKLHHCVGAMGYDKKMADEKSLIAFIRNKKDVDKPFVTLEIRIDLSKPYLNQLYGDHDSKPSKAVEKFAKEFEQAVILRKKEIVKERKRA